MHKAPRLKTSVRLCRGGFERLWLKPSVSARVIHPYESIFLARLSDKHSPKSACDGKSKRSNRRFVASFCNFFFQKEKVERSSFTKEKAVLCNFLSQKIFRLFLQPEKNPEKNLGILCSDSLYCNSVPPHSMTVKPFLSNGTISGASTST